MVMILVFKSRTTLPFLNKKELFSAFHHSKTMNYCENSLFFKVCKRLFDRI